MRILLLACALLGLFSCASIREMTSSHPQPSEWDQHLQSRLGKNINDIISSVGPPAKTFAMSNGNIIYTFARFRDTQSSGYSAYGGYSASSHTPFCRVDYTVSNDIITNYSWRGDDCN